MLYRCENADKCRNIGCLHMERHTETDGCTNRDCRITSGIIGSICKPIQDSAASMLKGVVERFDDNGQAKVSKIIQEVVMDKPIVKIPTEQAMRMATISHGEMSVMDVYKQWENDGYIIPEPTAVEKWQTSITYFIDKYKENALLVDVFTSLKKYADAAIEEAKGGKK